MSEKRTVLVAGATGQQGGAVARALVRRGHHVRALVRDPESPAARALGNLGVELRRGDLEDAASIEAAAAGADAAFLVTVPLPEVASELRQGRTAIDAFARARVGHVVYTSAANADRVPEIPTNATKRDVEAALAASGLSYTIVAPAYFMENLETPFARAAIAQGRLPRFLPRTTRLQLIAVDDIGRFVAYIVEHPEGFTGRRIDIAGDALDGDEMATVLCALLGHDLTVVEVSTSSLPDTELGRSTAALAAWLAREGFSADIEGLRRDYPTIGWQRFVEWARRREWTGDVVAR